MEEDESEDQAARGWVRTCTSAAPKRARRRPRAARRPTPSAGWPARGEPTRRRRSDGAGWLGVGAGAVWVRRRNGGNYSSSEEARHVRGRLGNYL